MHRRLSVLIAVMTLVHGVVLWRWPLPVIQRSAFPAPMPELTVEMYAPREVVPEVRSPAQAAAVHPSQAMKSVPVIGVDSLSAPVHLPGNASEAAASPAGRLNLTPPSEPLPSERDAVPGLAFRPALAEAVSRRRAEQERHVLLAQARVERLGLDERTFNSVDQRNGHMKTARGCFDMRADIEGRMGVLSDGRRFWMTRCRETERGVMKPFPELRSRSVR